MTASLATVLRSGGCNGWEQSSPNQLAEGFLLPSEQLMADPVSLATIGIGSAAAGGLTGAIGSLFSGNAQAGMYNYQAGVAQVNATLASQDANYAIQSGDVEAGQSGLRTRAQVGATKTGIGAGNIDVNSGSASKVIASETEIGQQNQGIIQANAAKRAYGFNVTAAQDTAQAGAYQTAASTSQTSGEIGAISSIIGGAGSVSSKWLQSGQYFGSGSGGGGGAGPGTYNG